MSTKPRSEIFCPDQQSIVHVMNRCVRRCFLLECDPATGKHYGHRRGMFEKELEKAAKGFAIDLLSYAIMDNHFHLILRNRPDVVNEWTDAKVVRQWHILCPIFKDENGFPIETPATEDVDRLAQDLEQVSRWRTRLSDISWLMKLVSQKIAKWCNAEDGSEGHFWQGRYKAVLLLDERALLACSVYVDLNRIQAELADSLESSDYTSIQRRLRTLAIRTSMRKILAEQINKCSSSTSIVNTVLLEETDSQDSGTSHDLNAPSDEFPLPDAHLSPVHIDEKHDPVGPHPSQTDSRCSDKGFLPLTEPKYIELLSWTADQLRRRQDGIPFDDCPPVLAQLQLAPDVWCKLATQFTDLFYVVAGSPENINNHRGCKTGKRFYMPQETREMLTT